MQWHRWRFRVVTSQNVNDELSLLTHTHGTPVRDPDGKNFKTLERAISQRVDMVSPNGTTVRDWLNRAYWEHFQSEEFLRLRCQKILHDFALLNDRFLASDQLTEVHNRVVQRTYDAARARNAINPERKRIQRSDFVSFVLESIDRQLHPQGAKKGEALERKMFEAKISPDHIANAQVQRRYYLTRMRAGGYLELDRRETIEARARQDFSRLLIELDTSTKTDNGPEFYKICLDRAAKLGTELSSQGEDLAPYIEGFLYEQAERCVHRFTRVKLEGK
jgi:hypothetical protein